MTTELDEMAKAYITTSIFNATVMGTELPSVEDVFKAGYQKATATARKFFEEQDPGTKAVVEHLEIATKQKAEDVQPV